MKRSTTLPSLLSKRTFRSVLLIPFEDQTLASLISNSWPDTQVNILSKDDLRGRNLNRSFRRLRMTRYDVVIASIHNNAIKRSLSSIEILLSITRSDFRFVRTDEQNLRSYSSSSFVFGTYPRVFIGLLLGVFIVSWTYFYLITSPRYRSSRARWRSAASQSPTVLYLRTDLVGSLQAGGSLSHMKGMMNAFLEKGIRVVLLSDSAVSGLPPRVEQVQLHPWQICGFYDELQLLAYNFQLILSARTIARRYSPTIVYQRHSSHNFAGGVLARRSQAPCILEVNASEVWVRRNWNRLFFDDLAVRCERLALQNADRIAVISTHVQEQLDSYRLDPGKFIVTPNGVNPEEFHPGIDGTSIRKLHRLDRRIVVGFIGTFHRWHGVETLFDAALLALQKNQRLRFFFIGDGELRSALMQRAHEHRLQEKLIFAGKVPHEQAPRYLSACDILVAPHLGFSDGTPFFGSPTKLFEYMAMGKAIIASNLGQLAAIIDDGTTGLQMKPGDAHELAELILKLASNTKLRGRLGKNARKAVVEVHSWASNVERILKSF